MGLRTPALFCVVLMLSGACAARHGRPIIGGTVVPNPSGTIAGHVRTSGGTPLDGRRVSAIGVVTAMRYETTTGSDGGYTIKVPEGTYRLEVELRGGDQLARQPKETKITLGDLDEGLDFVIGR
jgi:hypothetical protein